MKKAILNEKEVCRLYTDEKLGTETVAKKLGTSKDRIREILKKNGIEMKKRGGQVTHAPYIVENFHIKKYINTDEYHYVALDKKTGVESKDIDNQSGFLTTYIEKNYGVQTPPLYERNQYYMTTGNYWWEQWFTVEKRENRKIKKCPYCDWTTYDVNNRGGSFRVHLKKAHNMSISEYLIEHPEDKDYMSFANPTLNIQYETDEKKYVSCAICGRKFVKISKQHINSHGLSVGEYEDLYGSRLCDEYYTFLRDKMIEQNSKMEPSFTSKPQIEIRDFITSKGFECELNNRKILKGKEIDIYIPSLKIGIEYNGNFWHAEGMNHKTKRTHQEKTECAISAGIKLVQIFEDELVFNKELVFSKISHLLKSDTELPSVPARKCEIKRITNRKHSFFWRNITFKGLLHQQFI